MNKIIDENYLDLIIDNMLVRNAESEDSQAIKVNDRYSIINVLNPDPHPCGSDMRESIPVYKKTEEYSALYHADIPDISARSAFSAPFPDSRPAALFLSRKTEYRSENYWTKEPCKDFW